MSRQAVERSAAEKAKIAADMLARVEELKPKFRERAAKTKEIRRVPDESVQELQDAGFFLSLQSSRYGGYELDPQDFFRIQMSIAEACMSTAWACGIIAVHSFQLALMPDQAQEDVYGDDIHTRVSSSYAPMGKVEVVDGGFKFSGRWGWSSGSDHCTWALLGGIIPGEGYRTFLVPRSDYEIVDTWHSMGLEGTGSNDIVINDVFVPEHRTHKQMDGFNLTNPGREAHSTPLFDVPWAQVFIRVVSSPAIGACRGALELYKETVLGKASSDPSKLAGDTTTQENIANAELIISEMEEVLYANFNRMMAATNAGQDIPLMDRAKYRYQASKVIDKSMQVVDMLFSVAGGASVFLGSEIQQRFRDIHTARAHVANSPVGFARNYGSMQLGQDNKDFFI